MKPAEQQTNEELYRNAVSTKDKALLTVAYNRFAPLVLLNAVRILDLASAKEITSLVMEKLLLTGKVKEIDNVAAYLHTVTRNTSLTWLNLESRRTTAEHGYAANIFSLTSVEFAENQSLVINDQEQRYTRLFAAIDKLKPEQRECLTLFYFGNYSYSNIAEITGLSIKKVTSALQNGRIRLLNMLRYSNL